MRTRNQLKLLVANNNKSKQTINFFLNFSATYSLHIFSQKNSHKKKKKSKVIGHIIKPNLKNHGKLKKKRKIIVLREKDRETCKVKLHASLPMTLNFPSRSMILVLFQNHLLLIPPLFLQSHPTYN